MNKKIMGIVIVLLVAVGIGAYSMRAPKPGADKKEVLIGATLPETGNFKGAAGPFRAFLNAWADTVNAKGGIYFKDYDKKLPVRFVIYDDGSDVEKAKGLYEKLINEDKVDLLMGPYASPFTAQVSTINERYQIPMIAVEANSDVIYSKGFKWIVGVLDTGRKWSWQYLSMIKAKTDVKTIAFISEDSPHNQEVYAGAVEKAKELGFTVVLQEVLPVKTTFFAPTIKKIKDANADMIFVASFDAKDSMGSLLVKELVKAGISPKALHVTHHSGDFQKALLGDAELVTGENYWMPGLTTGAPVDEFNALLSKSGLKVEEYPWLAIRMYALQTLETALPNAGSLDKTKIMAALKSASVDTIGGKLTFNERGVGTMNPTPTQIQGGKYITIWPENIAAGKYIYPRNVNLKK